MSDINFKKKDTQVSKKSLRWMFAAFCVTVKDWEKID